MNEPNEPFHHGTGLPPETIDALIEQLRLALAGAGAPVELFAPDPQTPPCLRKLANLILLIADHEICDEADEAAHLFETVEQKRLLEEALDRALASEAHARAVLEVAAECIISIDERGIIQTFNPACEKLFGHLASEVLGRNVSGLMPEPYRSAHDSYLQRYMNTGESHVIGIGRAIVAQRKDGSVFPAELAVNPYQVNGSMHFVGTLHDISARMAAEHALRQAASTDHLTGLLNRKGLTEGLRIALDKARQGQHLLGLIYIDLDDFKPVNDTLGHAAGDECLRTVANRLIHALKSNDLIVRLGGDEFVAVVTDLPDQETLHFIARRILHSLSAPMELMLNRTAHLGCSLGLSMYPRHGDSAKQLMYAADQAMYAAKRLGKNAWRMAGEDG